VETPIFLDEKIVYSLHRTSIEKFGGTSGVRDRTLIQSALGAAINTYVYGDGDVFAIAAAYLFHLAQAQAFLDGNKRTAVATALVFLAMNGIEKAPGDLQLYDAVIAIAEKRLDKIGLAEIFQTAALSVD
jgi:death-on-curing protein